MRLAGVEIKDSAAAQLACILHDNGEQALAIHLGEAVDRLDDHLALSGRDREAVLGVLMDCARELPDDLADLRASLLADQLAHASR